MFERQNAFFVVTTGYRIISYMQVLVTLHYMQTLLVQRCAIDSPPESCYAGLLKLEAAAS